MRQGADGTAPHHPPEAARTRTCCTGTISTCRSAASRPRQRGPSPTAPNRAATLGYSGRAATVMCAAVREAGRGGGGRGRGRDLLDWHDLDLLDHLLYHLLDRDLLHHRLHRLHLPPPPTPRLRDSSGDAGGAGGSETGFGARADRRSGGNGGDSAARRGQTCLYSTFWTAMGSIWTCSGEI